MSVSLFYDVYDLCFKVPSFQVIQLSSKVFSNLCSIENTSLPEKKVQAYLEAKYNQSKAFFSGDGSKTGLAFHRLFPFFATILKLPYCFSWKDNFSRQMADGRWQTGRESSLLVESVSGEYFLCWIQIITLRALMKILILNFFMVILSINLRIK